VAAAPETGEMAPARRPHQSSRVHNITLQVYVQGVCFVRSHDRCTCSFIDRIVVDVKALSRVGIHFADVPVCYRENRFFLKNFYRFGLMIYTDLIQRKVKAWKLYCSFIYAHNHYLWYYYGITTDTSSRI